MLFTDSSQTDAKSIQKDPQKSIPRTQLDHAMCFGTFDIFHPGHIYYLSEAQKLAHKMTIIIARDTRVFSIKWRSPIDDESHRLTNVQNAFPDAQVILWDEKDIYAPIRNNAPDLLVFGYDQKVPLDRITSLFPTLETIRINWYEIEKYKTSLLRNQL